MRQSTHNGKGHISNLIVTEKQALFNFTDNQAWPVQQVTSEWEKLIP